MGAEVIHTIITCRLRYVYLIGGVSCLIMVRVCIAYIRHTYIRYIGCYHLLWGMSRKTSRHRDLPSTGVSTIEQGGSHRAVVPKQIRQDMDLDEGDELKWVYDDGVLTVYLHSKHGE